MYLNLHIALFGFSAYGTKKCCFSCISSLPSLGKSVDRLISWYVCFFYFYLGIPKAGIAKGFSIGIPDGIAKGISMAGSIVQVGRHELSILTMIVGYLRAVFKI
jgi:hypothetical protein